MGIPDIPAVGQCAGMWGLRGGSGERAGALLRWGVGRKPGETFIFGKVKELGG